VLRVAKILKSNGIDGGLLIGLFDIEAEGIDFKEPVFIIFDGLPVPFFVSDIQARGASRAVMHLVDVTSLADAEEMVGREVFVEGESEKESGEDLLGWTVLDKGRKVGEVSGIEPIPGNFCIYIGDALVPLHEDFIISADPGRRVLDLDLPEGLI